MATRQKLIRHQPAKLASHTYDLSIVQENILRAIDPVVEKAFVGDSQLLEDITLTAGQENWLEHGLDRDVRGFWVVATNAAVCVSQPSDSEADLEVYLPLMVTTDVTVDVVVF